MGEIVDLVIPLQGFGHFPSDCFSKVLRNVDALTIEMKDEEDTMSLKCGVDGVILECDMQAEPLIPQDAVCGMFDEVAQKVVSMTEAKSKINRLGVVFKYTISPFGNSAQELFTNLLKMDLKGTPDNIHIRMALKNPAKDALYHPDKKADYQNAIIEVSSEREDDKKAGFPTKMHVSVDYQMYYEPTRTLGDIDIRAHFNSAGSYIESSVKMSVLNFQLK
ncbi:MAG: hypothetical protein Q8J68_09450 [Methanolobus sp.]|uniref:hypothetical protein n=1 Tax=Methanolobus sp. TaxID=1874737 RepID=UPI00272FC2A2|nr:hypothetical protein [Methanolobus sp.]MDP2217498.1 hypothetical protein [Methanolobus sp.]